MKAETPDNPSADRTHSDAVADGVQPGSTTEDLEVRVARVGSELVGALKQVLEAVSASVGPSELARRLNVDKVLTSRTFKMIRSNDPVAAVHLAPGPEPLRRLLRAAGKAGVPADQLAPARDAVELFEALIRLVGDRSALDAILSAWLPEARQEFELRRKQAIFRAMSQLKGAAAEVNLSTVLLSAADDGVHLDVVWLFGLYGLRRLRPGSAVKFASRRVAVEGSPRCPRTLSDTPVAGLEGLRLDAFCSSPVAQLDVQQAGEFVHYTLANHGFGPGSAIDLVFAEVNRAETDRYAPVGSRRKGFVFAEVGTPSRTLVFDILVARDVYPDSPPMLHIYDAAFDGIADVNDRARDIDRLDLTESIALCESPAGLRTADVPRYTDLLRHVFTRLGWDEGRFRCYRVRIDYPLYGSQVTVAFDRPPRPQDLT
jgi:hypothetical protein